MPPNPKAQPTRFAIQKARGKGWKTLEVGEELEQTRARFDLMVTVNPRAYFRLIQLNHRSDSAFDGLEFDWALIELHDPNRPGSRPAARVPAGGRPPGSAPSPSPSPSRGRPARGKARDKVRLPLRFYLAVVLVGLLAGVILTLHYGLPAR